MPIPASYSVAQKGLHWGIAALVAAQYLVFDGVGRAFGAGMREGTFTYSGAAIGHIATGILVLALMLARLRLRLTRGAPPPPASEPAPARLAAGAVHWAFYVVLVALPLSGLAAWFLPSREVAEMHEFGTNLLLGLIGLHVAAVAVHQLWWRTGLLGRMT